jgi:sentrin-specific protease 1
MITDFGRHPNFRKELDVEQLAYSVRSWPGFNYNISACKSVRAFLSYFQHDIVLHLISSILQIHIPVHSNGDFILFILDKDTHTVHILDPTPIDPIYQYNPHAKYLHRLIWIAEYLPKAMSKACPGSRWNENILLWRHKIVDDIPVYNR